MDNSNLITITLTTEQWSALRVYLSITAKDRDATIRAWDSLSLETNPDGTPRYPHAAENAACVRRLDAALRSILSQT